MESEFKLQQKPLFLQQHSGRNVTFRLSKLCVCFGEMKRLAAMALEDRISSLPDCLLIEILSRLDDTKYAIRTATLSKRWQHLWPQLSNLSFTHYTDHNIPQFYSSLERILQTQTHVNKLKLHAYYDDQNQTHVSNCIRNAISRNVQEVDFYITNATPFGFYGFVLPDFFFTCSSFIRVSLCRCKFERAGVISWENLRTLHISGFLDDDMIENILSGCPLLETLELARGYGYQRIDITTNKSVKNLGFFEYQDPDSIYTIQINAPYILTLAIKGELMLNDLMLLNVSLLIEVELNYSKKRFFRPVDIHEEQETNEEMLKGHLLNLAHAKEVKVKELCLETLARLKAKGFVIPSNLKVLGEIASG